MVKRIKPVEIFYEKSNSILIDPVEYRYYTDIGYKESPYATHYYNKIRVVKPAQIYLKFTVGDNPEVHIMLVNNLVYQAYEKQRLSEKQSRDFFNELQTGQIVLLYSDVYDRLEMMMY